MIVSAKNKALNLQKRYFTTEVNQSRLYEIAATKKVKFMVELDDGNDDIPSK